MIMNSGHVLSARFVLVRPLGQSSTGEVWLAQDRELGGHVVLKILSGQLAANAAAAVLNPRYFRKSLRGALASTNPLPSISSKGNSS
jgi:serine/threonine protein kinase